MAQYQEGHKSVSVVFLPGGGTSQKELLGLLLFGLDFE